MNEQFRSPEGEAMWSKAQEIAQFLRDNLNNLDPEKRSALYGQIGIREDSSEDELIARAMDPENYIAASSENRQKIDDMYESLKSAILGE